MVSFSFKNLVFYIKFTIFLDFVKGCSHFAEKVFEIFYYFQVRPQSKTPVSEDWKPPAATR